MPKQANYKGYNITDLLLLKILI